MKRKEGEPSNVSKQNTPPSKEHPQIFVPNKDWMGIVDYVWAYAQSLGYEVVGQQREEAVAFKKDKGLIIITFKEMDKGIWIAGAAYKYPEAHLFFDWRVEKDSELTLGPVFDDMLTILKRLGGLR